MSTCSHEGRFFPASVSSGVRRARLHELRAALRAPASGRYSSAIALLLAAALLLVGGCGGPAGTVDESMRAGQTEFEAGRYDEARAMFELAAAHNRESPEPSYWMGQCCLALARQRFDEDLTAGALRNCDRAIAYFDSAIEAFPGFGRAVEGKAEALRLKGRHAAARELADWTVAHSGSQAKKLILKAHLYAQSGDMDQAQLAFKQATAVEPDNAAVHAELGLFYLRCGNEPAAIRSLRRAYKLNPGAPGVVTGLAKLSALPETSSRQ